MTSGAISALAAFSPATTLWPAAATLWPALVHASLLVPAILAAHSA
jgi:hypothetical protein